jgi:hypothetical protein
MTTIIASADTLGISSLGRRVGRSVSLRKKAMAHRLENLVLELLAAAILIAIFLIMTDPATRDDPDVGQSDVPSNS